MIEFKKIRKLNLPIGSYCVIGSGPLEIAGIRDAKDTDILVNEDLWKELTKKYPVTKDEKTHKFMIKLKDIEIAKDLRPLIENSDEIIKNSEVIQGIPFASLEDIRKIKEAMNRPKDVEDIKLINEYLGE